MTACLRTPDSRFENLPDYDFKPHYADIDGIRMHYVDEGPSDGSTILLLHGEPSWSYLYRHMIPPLRDAGHRVIAPDLIGFGKSDKPIRKADYSYAGHVAWMTLVCRDTRPHRHNTVLPGLGFPDRASGRGRKRRNASHASCVGNGGMPTGDEDFPKAFMVWRAFARFSPWFPIGRILQSGTVKRLNGGEFAAYDAPFPSSRYKAGARAFPKLVPTEPDDPASDANRVAWKEFAEWNEAVPDDVQQQGSDNARWRYAMAGNRARRTGPGPHDHKECRALPAGRQGRGTRRGSDSGLSLEVLELVLDVAPLVGICGRVLHLGDDRPFL